MAPRLGHGSRHGAAGRTADAPRHEARRLAGRDGPCDLCGPANDYIGSAAPRPRGRQLSWHVCISARVSGRGRRGAGGTRGHADPTAPDRLAPPCLARTTTTQGPAVRVPTPNPGSPSAHCFPGEAIAGCCPSPSWPTAAIASRHLDSSAKNAVPAFWSETCRAKWRREALGQGVAGRSGA